MAETYQQQYQRSDYRKLPGESLPDYMKRMQQQGAADTAGAKKFGEQQQYRKEFDTKLGRFDETQGKFFDQMRAGFRQRSQSMASGQLTGGLSALNQAGARSGTSFSGVNQAATGNLYGQIGAAQVEAQSGYDQKLNELRQTNRDQFVQGQFDYFDELQKMSYAHDLEKDLVKFQAEIADQYSSGWGQFFGALGQGIGLLGSGGLSSIFGGGGTGNAQNYRMGGGGF